MIFKAAKPWLPIPQPIKMVSNKTYTASISEETRLLRKYRKKRLRTGCCSSCADSQGWLILFSSRPCCTLAAKIYSFSYFYFSFLNRSILIILQNPYGVTFCCTENLQPVQKRTVDIPKRFIIIKEEVRQTTLSTQEETQMKKDLPAKGSERVRLILSIIIRTLMF